MFNKKCLILILLAQLNFTFSLKSTDFCTIKQKECKGYNDESQNYQIKCNPIKCYGTFKHKCGESNICSKNLAYCDEYNQLDSHIKMIHEIQLIDSILNKKYLEQKKEFILFKQHIQDCKIKTYKFQSIDFCENGRNCKVLLGKGSKKIAKEIDCKCPSQQSLKCGKYCSIDSNACDFYRSIKNKKYFTNIQDCGNHNATYFRSFLDGIF